MSPYSGPELDALARDGWQCVCSVRLIATVEHMRRVIAYGPDAQRAQQAYYRIWPEDRTECEV